LLEVTFKAIGIMLQTSFDKLFENKNILGVVKRNPLFLHEIEWKNNGFLFTTPNIIAFY